MTDGITIEDGVLRVSSSYGLKVGLPNYSSEDAHTSFSFEIPAENVADLGALVEQLVNMHATIKDGVKLATIAELGQGFEITEDGTVRPVLTASDIPTAAPKTAPKAAAARATTPPAGDTFFADFGQGQVEYIDNRPKKQSGEFKPTAADFRSKDRILTSAAGNPQYHSVWINGKDGTPNVATINALSAAGVAL